VNADLIERQKQSFDKLVDSGVYSADFEHDSRAKLFVASVIKQTIPRARLRTPLRVLDCGCGTGAWLQFIRTELVQVGHEHHRLCGFDISGRMVDVAQAKLRDVAQSADLRTGNVLEAQSYDFDGIEDGFDLIFTYDVVQQLPRRRQFDACRAIVGALAPNGTALVFDNDSRSRFGRRMAIRKFMTRYFGLQLVPRYFCNASYPPLEKFRHKIAIEGSCDAQIAVRDDGIKRALVISRTAHGRNSDENQPVSTR
jgi:SAM-dependent methyltransferase